MINQGKFGTQEAIWLTTITISSKVFYTSPALAVSLVGNASWYMTLISAGVATIGFTIIYLLLKRFPNKDIIAIFDDTMGKIAGFSFSGILGLYLLFMIIIQLSEFAEVIKAYVFPLTPTPFIIGLFVVGVLTMNLLGLESLARFAKLSVYTMFAGFIIVLLLGMQNYDINRLFPILGYGIDKTIFHGIIRSSAYSEIVILAVFAGSLQGIKHVRKVGYTSLIISGILISISLLVFTLSFPYYTAGEITAPMYEMASLIDYGRFVQRVEPIFLFIWIISTFISITAIFYCFINIYCKMFRIQDTKPIIIGSAIILFAASMLHPNMTSVIFGSVPKTRQYSWLPTFGLPLISLIIGKLRKKGVKYHA